MGNEHRAVRAGGRAVAVTVAAVVVMMSAGCASTAGPAATRSASASGSTGTASASADAADFGPAPAPGPSCDVVLPIDAARTIVPTATPTDRIAMHDVDGAWFAAATVGGVECAAGNDVSTVDDSPSGAAGEPVYQGVVVTVLPDAADAYADYRSDAAADGATEGGCHASDSARLYCDAEGLAGSAWVVVSATRVQDAADAVPEVMDPRLDTLLQRVVAAVSTTPLAHGTAGPPRHEVAPTACSATRVNAVTSAPLEDAWDATDFLRTAGLVALARAGADRCEFLSTGTGAQPYSTTGAMYTVLPDGGWVVRERLAAGSVDRSDRLHLTGLRAGDGAWRTCDDTACSIDVVHGGDWSHYVLLHSVAPDTSAAIARWVRSSWRP